MEEMLRKHTIIGTLLTVSLLAAGCGSSDGGGEGDGTYRLTLGMPSSDTFLAGWFGFLAADKLKYWEEEGLAVEFVAIEGSGGATEQVAAGNVDAGIPSMPSVVEAMGAGVQLVNTYTYDRGMIYGIFAPEGSGINSVADLAGKKIGISEAGGGEVAFLAAALRAEDIDPVNGATMIPVGDGGPTTYQAIESGAVDAYSSAYNDVFAMQVNGLEMADLTPTTFEGFPARGVIALPETVQDKSEELKRLLRGVAKGTLYCQTAPQLCVEMMREAVPQQWEENAGGMSQGQLRFDLGIEQTKLGPTGIWGAHDPEEAEEFVKTIAESVDGFQDVDMNQFLNNDFLDFANDFDQQAVIDQANADAS